MSRILHDHKPLIGTAGKTSRFIKTKHKQRLTLSNPNLGNRHQANFRKPCAQESTVKRSPATAHATAVPIPECRARSALCSGGGPAHSPAPPRRGASRRPHALTAWSTGGRTRGTEGCVHVHRVKKTGPFSKTVKSPNALQSETTRQQKQRVLVDIS